MHQRIKRTFLSDFIGQLGGACILADHRQGNGTVENDPRRLGELERLGDVFHSARLIQETGFGECLLRIFVRRRFLESQTLRRLSLPLPEGSPGFHLAGERRHARPQTGHLILALRIVLHRVQFVLHGSIVVLQPRHDRERGVHDRTAGLMLQCLVESGFRLVQAVQTCVGNRHVRISTRAVRFKLHRLPGVVERVLILPHLDVDDRRLL